MKVLALVSDAYGAYGGIAQYNRDFIEALGAEPDVQSVDVLPRIGDVSGAQPMPKVMLHRPCLNKLIYSLRAIAICARIRPDVIFNGHLYLGPLASRLARLFGAKMVSQLHGTEAWEPLSANHLDPLKKSDVVLCVSRDTCDRYRQQASGANNAVLLHNTVGTEFSVGERLEARRRFGIDDEFALLTVGRLDPRKNGYKGHEKVIRALPGLSVGGRKVTYLIAGIGEDHHRLEQVAEEAGVRSSVRFLGKVAQEDLPDLYRAADLFALPSEGEGFGIVYLEAMACGTPAIGIDVGGVPDALDNGKLGWLAQPEEFSTVLQQAVQQALDVQRRDRELLSERVTQAFGLSAFRRNVTKVMGLLK